jgi:hypothetical protein
VRHDAPRGPTSEQLRRRVLAHVERVASVEPVPVYLDFVQGAKRCTYCGPLSPQGCQNGPCGFHGANA